MQAGAADAASQGLQVASTAHAKSVWPAWARRAGGWGEWIWGLVVAEEEGVVSMLPIATPPNSPTHTHTTD